MFFYVNSPWQPSDKFISFFHVCIVHGIVICSMFSLLFIVFVSDLLKWKKQIVRLLAMEIIISSSILGYKHSGRCSCNMLFNACLFFVYVNIKYMHLYMHIHAHAHAGLSHMIIKCF